jgi:Mg2+-importing ATPase
VNRAAVVLTIESETRPPGLRWVPWVIGAALLAALIAAVSQLAEEREFARLLASARPAWLLVAAALQAATYVAQAEVFRAATPLAAQRSLSRAWLYELSLTKLFLDQALPSAGVSSTAMIVKALESRGVSRSVAAACAMINIASYHAAYVLALCAALAIASMRRETSWVLLSLSGFFIAFATAMSVGIIALAGRKATPGSLVTRVPGLRGVVQLLERADATLVRQHRVLRRTTMWQLAIVLLDAATMWACLRAIGADAPPAGVFVSFMVASLVRTMGVVPGGLGTYEATSVLTLRLLGISVSAALSATLMFRGLSFWIPMLPGFWASHRILQRRPSPRAQHARRW